MLHKIIETGSWDKIPNPVYRVKVSSRGLVGHDLDEFLKVGSDIFLPYINEIEVGKGEIPIHLIAVGSHEFYGPNRKGDAFSEEMCRKCHKSFEKYAGVYYEHMKSDPKKSFGKVKKSAYNDSMHRIELLITLNATKEAADRNNGIVAPDFILDQLEKTGTLSFSMGCYPDYDVCGNCLNKSYYFSHYCDETNCVNPYTGRKGFGCKRGLGKVASDGVVQYVDNYNPVFVDISYVHVPADRIAYGGVADYLAKAASATAPVKEVFEQRQFHSNPVQEALFKATSLLAVFDRQFLSGSIPQNVLEKSAGFSSKVRPRINTRFWRPYPDYSTLLQLAKYADDGVVLTPEEFSHLFNTRSENVPQQIRAASQGIFCKLAYPDVVRSPEGRAAMQLLSIPESAQSTSTTWSLKPEVFSKAASVAIIRGANTPLFRYDMKKTAGIWHNSAATEVAKYYAMYKAAALVRMMGKNWFNNEVIPQLVVEHYVVPVDS